MTEEATAEESSRPEFRGCMFCYAAEWVAYGARKAAGSTSTDHSSQ